jgi:hypothetical protein
VFNFFWSKNICIRNVALDFTSTKKVNKMGQATDDWYLVKNTENQWEKRLRDDTLIVVWKACERNGRWRVKSSIRDGRQISEHFSGRDAAIHAAETRIADCSSKPDN